MLQKIINFFAPRHLDRIYLVRHGESVANVDPTMYHRIADHALPLTERGRAQARQVGQFLREEFQKANLLGAHIRLWVSPYKRTRETADEIEKGAEDGVFTSRRENVSLREQHFGLFDGYTEAERKRLFPKEYEHYERCRTFEGGVFANMPMGESRIDVAERVQPFFGTIMRDAKKGVGTLVVVSHGVTIRAFAMGYMHFPYEWLEEEKNPQNASVYLIQRDKKGTNKYNGRIFVPNI